MKKLAVLLCLSGLTTGAFAQGLVNFFNTSSTLSSATVGGSTGATSGAAGSWYYGLLIAAPGTTDPKAFTFAGAYATNVAFAGRFTGGTPGVTGWAPGANMAFEVAVWSANLGPTFQNGWLTGNFGTATSGNFGLSGIASGVAGGGSPPAPAFNLFGGTGGIQSGFNAPAIGSVVVPEPTSMALAGLGAAALFIFRRRK
jgi:hypothetical protein